MFTVTRLEEVRELFYPLQPLYTLLSWVRWDWGPEQRCGTGDLRVWDRGLEGVKLGT